jgi:hypothetical protein
MLQQQPQSRAPRLPLIALACTVVLAAVLPIAAATAGPAGPPREGRQGVPSASPGSVRGAEGAGVRASDASEALRGGPRRVAGDSAGGVSASSCGDELASPEGLTVQTCVMSAAEETWGRMYYRNARRSPLRAALTLTRPDGTSVRVDCTVPAGGGPAACETPREKRREGARPYVATAEAGSADGERLLLRSSSNSPALSGS